MFRSFLVASLLFVAGVHAIGRTQSVGAHGRLTCKGQPATGVLIKLYDHDRDSPDDLMAKTYTDQDGAFQLEGYADEISTIDPKLNFYHDCDDILPCQKKFSILIPDMYITSGKVPSKYFDSGVLPLEAEYPGQSRDCIHFIGIKGSIGDDLNNQTQF